MKALVLLLLFPFVAFGATTLAPGTYTVPACVVTTPPPPPPPTCVPPNTVVNGVCTPPATANGVSWVYHAGKFYWISDYSWNGDVNYKDTVGNPGDGTMDIAFTLTGPWGGWQPFDIPGGTNGPGFDTRPYKTLRFCTKPTVANQSHGMGIDANNDVADGVPIAYVAGGGVTKYGPLPVVGQWGCYSVPIADFKLTNPFILKFSLTDGTGQVPNKFYIKEVGFYP